MNSATNSSTGPMKILLIGSGGREHALAYALSQSQHTPQLFFAPGNPGMEALGERLSINTEDLDNLVRHSQREGIDLTIVGPEAPLAEGIVDRFQEAGLLIFGPTQAAAQLEASKHFAKTLMAEANVPTAQYRFCPDGPSARQAITEFTPPFVIKEDGLAAGKGVTVTESLDEAYEALDRAAFKQVPVVLESFLKGQELSILAICDGTRALPLMSAQDFKRVGENNTGPNTGGMGAYAPVPFVDEVLMEKIQNQVLNPVLKTMANRGTPFTGVLYAGLMIDEHQNPSVVEFNVRFGDPETQVVLPLLETDLVDLCMASAQGDLSVFEAKGIQMKPDTHAVTVVAASEGYPGTYEKGKPISIGELPDGVICFHAGTTQHQEDGLVTAGGRVLNLTGLGSTLEEARKRAYNGITSVRFDGIFCRPDIAHQAVHRGTHVGSAS